MVAVPVLSVTFAMKEKLPTEDVVPAIVPVVEPNWIPAGKAPEFTVQW